MRYESYEESAAKEAAINFLKWTLAYLFVGLGFTFPAWGALLGII